MNTTFGTTETDTLSSRCEQHNRDHALPAVVDQNHQIVLALTGISAIVMPAQLGAGVQTELRAAHQYVPIIAHADFAVWTFLADPPDGIAADFLAYTIFARAGVHALGDRAQIILPSPKDELAGSRTWIAPPSGALRPTLHAVARAVRRADEGG